MLLITVKAHQESHLNEINQNHEISANCAELNKIREERGGGRKERPSKIPESTPSISMDNTHRNQIYTESEGRPALAPTSFVYCYRTDLNYAFMRWYQKRNTY